MSERNHDHEFRGDFQSPVDDCSLEFDDGSDEKAEKAIVLLSAIAGQNGVTLDQIDDIETVVPGAIFDNYPEGGYSDIPRQEGSTVVMEGLGHAAIWVGGAALIAVLAWIVNRFLGKGGSSSGAGGGGSPYSAGTSERKVEKALEAQEQALEVLERHAEEVEDDAADVLIPIVIHMQSGDSDDAKHQRELAEHQKKMEGDIPADLFTKVYGHGKVSRAELCRAIVTWALGKNAPKILNMNPTAFKSAMNALGESAGVMDRSLNLRLHYISTLFKELSNDEVDHNKARPASPLGGDDLSVLIKTTEVLGKSADVDIDAIVRPLNPNADPETDRAIVRALTAVVKSVFASHSDPADEHWKKALIHESSDLETGWYYRTGVILHECRDVPELIADFAKASRTYVSQYEHLLQELERLTGKQGLSEDHRSFSYDPVKLNYIKMQIAVEKDVATALGMIYSTLETSLKGIFAVREEAIKIHARFLQNWSNLIETQIKYENKHGNVQIQRRAPSRSIVREISSKLKDK